jgi:serine protease
VDPCRPQRPLRGRVAHRDCDRAARCRARGSGPALVLALLAAATLACGGGGGSGDAEADELDPLAPRTFAVAGEIGIAFAAAVDGDVNDPSAPYTANDDLATAQPLSNPVTLGGYVNVPAGGAPGRSFVAGDPVDVYRISLAAGQAVRLFRASDDPRDDLDLSLVDANDEEVAVSDGDTASEVVVAADAGEYRIRVTAFSGASNYVLVVSHAPAAVAMGETAESVPGELLIRFRGAGSADEARTRRRIRGLGLRTLASMGSGWALVSPGDPGRMDEVLRNAGIGHLSERDLRGRGRMRRATRLLAKALRRREDVIFAEPNYLRRAHAVPTDEFFPLQWNLPMVGLPNAWDQIDPAGGAIVAVVDTGVVGSHPDLRGQLVEGYDFISDPESAADGDGCDPDPEDPGDAQAAGQSSYHGTHIAGIVAARSSLQDGDDENGIAGAAWSGRVMPLRVLGRRGGTDFDLIQAVRYAAGLDNACGVLPDVPARVLNLSLGGPSPSAALDAALAEARAAGLVIVASAGNQASAAAIYPAASPGVISVSSVDTQEMLAPYSSYGASIDVAAPGGDLAADANDDGYPDGVLSTLLDDRTDEFVYAFYQGTSMAAPHVSGVVALMLGANPDLMPPDVDALLAAGAMTRDLGNRLLYGNGLIDAQAAVSAAIAFEGGTPPAIPPRLEAAPGLLNLGARDEVAVLILANAGGEDPPLAVASTHVTTDDGGDWLRLEPQAVDGSGLGRYEVRVERDDLGVGIYTGSIDFTSNAGSLQVPVLVQVGAEIGAAADAGLHFVLLLDASSGATVQSAMVEAEAGVYRYAFSGVEAGEYLVFAGTDSDNDAIVCDPGEACGGYPTLEEPRPVRIEGNETALDFVTGFALRLSGSAVPDGRRVLLRDAAHPR